MSNQYYYPDQAFALAYSMNKKNNIPVKSVKKRVQNSNFTGDWTYSEWKQLASINCNKTNRFS